MRKKRKGSESDASSPATLTPTHDSLPSYFTSHYSLEDYTRLNKRFFDPESSKICRHEMALDANGRRLLVTSGLVRAPIYQVRGHRNGLRTLPHSAAITTVDWHPTLPIFMTGSAITQFV
ncbi:hypothetical protein FH972_000854 [Carpinus fangiana]|uniref:Anaphase-promoting complex subunit 4 WD40 domain-containing protein n=1 Tax=Carpinus fangiana TaxID=176857 RepID=A0A5N6QA73_9ROSI|nr:hypothetical protein FH972_000854 [Carpinus fangiana]